MLKSPHQAYVCCKKEGTEMPNHSRANITVHYTERFLTEENLTAPVTEENHFSFSRVGMVIPGWDEGLMDMKKGERRTLIIPPDLGYAHAEQVELFPQMLHSFLMWK
jgi:FKBP-type peptidyl-prolyl cis-trans isomerase